MPWQEGPAEFSGAPVWRYGENPIIGRNPVKEVARIFNSAVMPYGDEFIGVFRGERTNGIAVHLPWKKQRCEIHWNFEMRTKSSSLTKKANRWCRFTHIEPRIVKDRRSLLHRVWIQDFYGAAIGMAKKKKILKPSGTYGGIHSFHSTEMPFSSREKSTTTLVMLYPVQATAATHRWGNVFLSESPDMLYWGKHRHIMSKSPEWWEILKIGGGAGSRSTTNEGWLHVLPQHKRHLQWLCIQHRRREILDKETPSVHNSRSRTSF